MERHGDILRTRRAFLHAATVAGLTVGVSLLAAYTRSVSTSTPTESPRATAIPIPATPTLPPTVAQATATVTPITTSHVAAAYLQGALDYIAQNSIMRDRVDWQQLRDDAMTLTQDAQTTADTYPAIRFAVQQLNDHHSSFFTPDQWRTLQWASASGLGLINKGRVIVAVYPSSPASQAGMQVRDVIIAVNGTPVESLPASQLSALAYTRTGGATLTLQRAGEASPITVTLTVADFDMYRPPQGRALTADIGYLELPAFSGMPERGVRYATTVQQAIRGADVSPMRGWIVDLRLNGGGNMYPMLAGVGPVLGAGEVGGFVDAHGNRTWFAYRDGVASLNGKALGTVDIAPYTLQRPMPPVAVLTSEGAASSGEAIVVAFRGRPATRSFGAPTAGVPTANAAKELSDGAYINLTQALDFDRTGQTYNAPIPPDQAVTMDWSLLDTDRDPVIVAARDWLRSQPGFS